MWLVISNSEKLLLLLGFVAVLLREQNLWRQAEVQAEERKSWNLWNEQLGLQNQQLGLQHEQLKQELRAAERRLASQESPECAPWSTWRVFFGDDCILDGPDCAQTAGFPNDNYASGGGCAIEFEKGADYMLLFEAFDVEKNWDVLSIGPATYSGNAIPKPVRVTGNTTLSWLTDATVNARGWRACLRAPCTSLSCPDGYRYREAQTCATLNCTDADVLTCCEPIIGCALPDSINETYTVPDECFMGSNHTVQSCTIGCAGDAVLDGWKLPQVCDVDSKVFTLPSCEVQFKVFPWNISGPCRMYGAGCVSSAHVGGQYAPDEACNISADSTLDLSAYQFWLTYLDTEPDFDTLSVDNPIKPGTNCDGVDYWYSLCYYFINVRPDDVLFSGAMITQGNPGPAIGPLPFKETLTWVTDASAQSTGFIVCAQAQCSTMICPSGYRFNCEAQTEWCTRHDCSLQQDVDRCCISETPQFLSAFSLNPGEAADADSCIWLVKVSTTTTTTLPLDYIGELHLELSNEEEVHGAGRAEILERSATAVAEAIQRLAHVQSDAVRTSWEELQNESEGHLLRVAFRVEASGVDLVLLSNEAMLMEMNVNDTHFDSIVFRTTAMVVATKDVNGLRPYGSLCTDLYECGSPEACWQEDGTGRSCGQLHALQWCSNDPLEPGPGFYQHNPGQTEEAYGQLWSLWRSASKDISMGEELATQVCCTCGGGTCSPGTFRSTVGAAQLCLPCQPGTTSSGQSCASCPIGRYADAAGAPKCKACPQGQYGMDEGSTQCSVCAKGAISINNGATACMACEPGQYSDDHLTCKLCLPGSYAADNSSSACEECPPGQFTEDGGASACQACREGTFATGGRTACDPCSSGRFASEPGLSACMACPKGEAQNKMGSKHCEQCEVGRHASLTGQHLCSDCAAGTESLIEGSSACDRCEPGFFKSDGEINCTSCLPGTYAAEPGLTACRSCPQGAHANTPEAATGCLSCSAGRFGSSESLTACELCTLGQYASEPDATECIECAPGDFANTTGLSTCLTCSPGSFTPVAGQSWCRECTPGREAPAPGAMECDVCVPGTYAHQTGTSSCLACPAGAFSHLGGQTACVACQTGRFAASSGGSECLPCQPGTFASEVGMTVCSSCSKTLPGVGEHWTTMSPPILSQQEGDQVAAAAVVTEIGSSISSSPAGEPWTELHGAVSKMSCGCRPGTQPVGSVCEPCGEGLICLGMGVLRIEDGYAWDGRHSVWDCSLGIEDACPGGAPGRCKEGRDEKSIACSLCIDKFVPVDDGSCVQCEGADYMVPSLFVILGLGIMIACYCFFDRANRRRPKLSVLLIVASMGQLVTIVQQLGIISLIRVAWTTPISTVFTVVTAVAFLDIQVLRPSCIFAMDVVTLYILRVGAVFIVLAIITLAHLVSQVLQHRQTWRTRWPTLWSALGTVVLTFFVTIVSTMLGPMQCRKHPNGRSTVSWYPSIACWEGNDHTTMITLGGIACLLPIFFLTACIIAVRRFPGALLRAETDFLNRWSFLFFRYSSQAYWYGPVMLVRNSLVSACPVISSPVMQILSLEIIMFSSLFVLLIVMPWRVRKANYLDGFAHMCLLMVTMMASFFVDDHDETHFVSTAGAIFICAVPMLVGTVLLYSIVMLVGSLKKPYQFFLCHHKLGAGCFCRVLKMWLSRNTQRKVFMDTDDLTNLDRLFDIVAHETETFVAIQSKNLLQRPWCVGEITTAHRSHIKLMHICMSGVQAPREEFIEKFLHYVPDISCLTRFSIDLEMIQDALRWLASSDPMAPPEELNERGLDALCSQMFGKRRSSMRAVTPGTKGPARQTTIIIICNHMDTEASASALILWVLYNPIVQHKENAFASVLAFEQEAPATVKKAMLICTNGVFTSRVLEALFVCEDARAAVLPIMNVTNFVFPSMAWMQEQGLFQNMTEEKQRRSMLVVQAIFQEIAVDFQPSALSGTEATLRIKAQEIAERLLQFKSKSQSEADEVFPRIASAWSMKGKRMQLTGEESSDRILRVISSPAASQIAGTLRQKGEEKSGTSNNIEIADTDHMTALTEDVEISDVVASSGPAFTWTMDLHFENAGHRWQLGDAEGSSLPTSFCV